MRAAKTEDAEAMAKYLKNKFTCLGLKRDERSRLAKVFMKAAKKSKTVNWHFVDYLWGVGEREFQYVALDYLDSLKGSLEAVDIGRIGNLAVQNSWWDSVDGLAVNLTGSLLFRFKTEIEPVIREWASHENMWLNRTSILCQLKFKQKTDCELLEYVILRNHETKEFFLNKAIGWALREYSKTDPEWVSAFINRHRLHPLSIREASKYLSVNE
ncbi:DNA alkylation repair protein [Fusibacter sp. A1]|nr:DNA alkylation repair protein [Fusibacter sp. A1]RXV63778.1 DNA alkylation repair protein [Fusibacter sp. A1]